MRWLTALLLALALQVHAVTVTDERGVSVTLAQPPQRIVTLMPALAEMVCELGACARLVGVDDYANWPEAVRRLPHVGGLEDARIEAIVALRPDVVLMPLSSRALARLDALGLKVVALEPTSMDDVRRVLLQIGEVLGLPPEVAQASWRRIDQGVEAAARSLPPALRGTRVYFEVSSGPYAASESSFLGQVLARVGAANVVPGALGPFPKLNPEFVVRADPDLIMLSDRNPQSLRQRPGWDRIRAVREQRICAFTPQQGDVLVRPGPRMAQGAQLMVQCLQGRLNGRAP
ncbi:ABC transporter substrate-binding protein [Caenimonas terrae]|uniref:ABC transporter substrate-binding protein n=1 Tax=Caenimonas terrae TaxID=696074 RepID=A0ABW0NAV6_9BURK